MYCDWPDLGRCCFCLPLRKGVLVFGYVSILLAAFMIGLHSFAVHHELTAEMVLYGKVMTFPSELCIAIYCIELLFDAVLIYGAHMQSVLYIKVYYYYAIATTLAVALMQIVVLCIADRVYPGMLIEYLTFTFAGVCLQLYLILLVRSLLRRMEMAGPHGYDNQLHQITSAEVKIDNNGVYNNTVAPAEV